MVLAIGLIAPFAIPAFAQENGGQERKVTERLASATMAYASSAAVCDSVAPGTFQGAVALLENKLGPLWGSAREGVEKLPESADVKKQIAKFKSWIASGEFEVVDLRQACKEQIEKHRQQLGFAIDAANFVVE
jgi:hypothetical protein